jgi:hypothetical protein
MKFHTKRYDIVKVDPEEFNDGIQYEINLADGYQFDDGSSLNYATDIDDLRALIAEIKETHDDN